MKPRSSLSDPYALHHAHAIFLFQLTTQTYVYLLGTGDDTGTVFIERAVLKFRIHEILRIYNSNYTESYKISGATALSLNDGNKQIRVQHEVIRLCSVMLQTYPTGSRDQKHRTV